MYVLGRDLCMNAMKQFMTCYCNFVKLPELFYHDDGYFLMKFHSDKDKDMVLMRGPYSIHNMPMILKDCIWVLISSGTWLGQYQFG